MSRAERIAATCGIGLAAVLAVVFHLAGIGWLVGGITGWLLCAGVNRTRS